MRSHPWSRYLFIVWCLWHMGIEVVGGQPDLVWRLVQTYEDGEIAFITPEQACLAVKEAVSRGENADVGGALICLPIDQPPPGGRIDGRL